ncbi:hypothetical protein SAZ_42400 [Streptomyces noursei ZPM]|nr:hypothetical protein SAZ_00405 [Streptomyces noursei ZPM]AKA09300.1 hypothetical protein SAZ_42400 [Streptomyces noursei ZPM]
MSRLWWATALRTLLRALGGGPLTMRVRWMRARSRRAMRCSRWRPVMRWARQMM